MKILATTRRNIDIAVAQRGYVSYAGRQMGFQHMPATGCLFLLSMIVLVIGSFTWASPAPAQPTWMLMSREGGCVSLETLVRREGLSHMPASPEEFAAMIRPRYPDVSVGLPDGFPSEMGGRAVMVKWAENRAPIFVRADLCR